MSAVTAAGFASPTLGLRTSTTLKLSIGIAMRAQPRKTTLSSSSSSLAQRTLVTHDLGPDCTASWNTATRGLAATARRLLSTSQSP